MQWQYRFQMVCAFKGCAVPAFFLIAFAFGLFQGMMPIIGYFAGQTFSVYIKSLDHWIALILLGFIGGKMVWEAISQMRHPEEENCEKTFTLRLLLVQAVATSIDALAVGIGFAVMDVIIWAQRVLFPSQHLFFRPPAFGSVKNRLFFKRKRQNY